MKKVLINLVVSCDGFQHDRIAAQMEVLKNLLNQAKQKHLQ